MPSFQYQAVNAGGQIETGTIIGADQTEAVNNLTRRGLTVENIQPMSFINDPLNTVSAGDYVPEQDYSEPPKAPSDYVYADQLVATPEERLPKKLPKVKVPKQGAEYWDPSVEKRSYWSAHVVGPMFGKVPLARLEFFFRQLSAMLRAGVPYVQTLDTLTDQARNWKLKKIVRELRGHVEQNRPISAGMQRYPEVFTPLVMSLVRAGEESDNLDEALLLVAEYLKQEIELRNHLRRVTIYPKLLVGASIVIILGTNAIIASVAPDGGKGLSSPLTTASTWYWLGPLIVFMWLFVRVGLSNSRIKHNWDLVLVCIPFMGATLRQFCMAKFGRAFSALYKGGIPMTKAIQLSADACGNEYLRSRIYPAVKQLETGAGLTDTLRQTKAFSPIVLDMTYTGETTGNLEDMLNRMCEYYEEEGKTKSVMMGYVFGVVTLALVAVYIGYIIVQFWMGHYAGVEQMIKDETK